MVEKVISLKKKRAIFIYTWRKLQKEVYDYWADKQTKIPQAKLQICEDHRLCLMAYVIIQSQSSDVYTSFLALNPFIDFNSMEEAVPLATVENAIQVIMKDYNDRQGPSAQGVDLISSLEGGPIFDNASKLGAVDYINVSHHRIFQPSDNGSFRSTNYINQIGKITLITSYIQMATKSNWRISSSGSRGTKCPPTHKTACRMLNYTALSRKWMWK